MKVAQINSVYRQGSTGRIASDLHECFKQNNIESKVFYGRGSLIDETNVTKISNNRSVFIDYIYTRIFNKHSESDFVNTKELIKELIDFQPDIIQLHNIHGYYLNYQILFEFFKESNIPIVWLMHDQWPLSGNAAYYDETKVCWEEPSREELQKLSKDYPKHLYLGMNNIIRNYELKKKTFNINNLYIVTPSDWLKRVFSKSYFFNTPVKVINNGIDLSNFSVNKILNNERSKILLGVASVWDRRKGFEYFLNLAKDLTDEYKIILVGISKKQKKILPDNIVGIEKTNSIEELVQLYNMADVFINPTLEDNFPTVNLEAQACGTPVITFNTGGSPESIIEGVTGTVAERGNYDQLIYKIEKWPKKTKVIQMDCRRNAEKYSKESMLNNYVLLYEEILERNS